MPGWSKAEERKAERQKEHGLRSADAAFGSPDGCLEFPKSLLCVVEISVEEWSPEWDLKAP